MALQLPPRAGISSGIIHSVPKDWDQSWYRRHIRDFLQWGDLRNTKYLFPLTIDAGNLNSQPTLSLAATLYTGTVALAKLTGGGSNGSLTIQNGVLTAYTPPT